MAWVVVDMGGRVLARTETLQQAIGMVAGRVDLMVYASDQPPLVQA